jgi:lysophospholipase L1-like esterase
MLRTVVRCFSITAIVFALDFAALQPGPQAQTRTNREHWVGTWATGAAWRPAHEQAPAAPAAAAQAPARPAANGAAAPSSAPGPVVPISINDQTLRQIVRTSIGGSRVRVVFSNVFGTVPLVIGGAHVARREKGAAIAAASGKRILFGGQPSTTIPAGAVIVSDEASLQVPPDADLAIDLYCPGNFEQFESPITLHNRAYQTNYVSSRGNHVGMADMPVVATTLTWHWLARVEVVADAEAYGVVTLGDSITDGFGSTIDTNRRWPDELRRRLTANPRTRHVGVLNMGIGGNRLLAEMNPGFGINALARFDRDVLAQPGVTHVIVMEGINDVGFSQAGAPLSAATLIAAQRQLIERAHARGLTIIGATLTPFEGANYWSAAGETARQGLNEWIRTGGAYDGVIDFDAAVRDPQHPTKFLTNHHAGDYLHPNDTGYKAMAAAVDLKLFERTKH